MTTRDYAVRIVDLVCHPTTAYYRYEPRVAEAEKIICEAKDAAHFHGANEMLARIQAMVEGWPGENIGGDITIATHLERIEKDAEKRGAEAKRKEISSQQHALEILYHDGVSYLIRNAVFNVPALQPPAPEVPEFITKAAARIEDTLYSRKKQDVKSIIYQEWLKSQEGK